jgi:tetratricopeptide (TPR) repeat protein
VSNRIGFGIALAVLGLAGSAASFAQDAAACPDKKFSKKIEKTMSAVEKAFTAKQWDEVLAKVAEAEGTDTGAEKTAFDKYWFNEFKGRAYLTKQQYKDAAPLLEASLNSPCMPDADKPSRYLLVVRLANEVKDFPKVIEVGNKAMALPGYDPSIASYVGNAYYATGDNANTRKIMTDVIAKEEAAGKKSEEYSYRILQSACIKMKDNPCIVDQLEKLVINYPKPEFWQDLTSLLMAQTKNNAQLVNIWRLAENNSVLSEAPEYLEYAQLAIGQGLPGEAQTVLEKGAAKGVFTDARSKQDSTTVLNEAKAAVALDKTTLAKQDASARAKPTGESDVKLGAAYLSYGDPAKAIEAIQRGLSKGGVKNTDDAGLLLGIAFLRSGNKPEADKAFDTVSQDPTMKRVAQLWKHSQVSP